ncbi:alpha-amylase family glycosyl hydrolase [Streptomyces sp. NPDC020801]|uniref:glycoside hydrolase family 13 protein n=1 Tax=unclassified Streptomyces TaxID=2593676 RepID=UPI0037B984A0
MAVLRVPWWRDAVMYQVYLRSFRDGNGDGVGDLRGARSGLPYLAALGVDGVWLSPCFPSPQYDHGYDVADYRAVDPLFGDLDEFGRLVDDAHRLGLKVLLDVVPNHCSIQHSWFQEALRSDAGSPARARFHFADGRGRNGELPPNNWRAMFGGPAWTRVRDSDGRSGQWYLHLFTPHQPDLDWRQPEVAEHFDDVLRFWLDRGVDGFRIDVAVGLYKHPGLPDSTEPDADEAARDAVNPLAWNQPEVHDVWRRWRALCDSYAAADGKERVLVGEVAVPTPADQALYLRPDELHQAFYFDLLHAPWDADAFRLRIDAALRDIAATGAPVTWVLNNHDQQRSVTRYSRSRRLGDVPDLERGAARARAAALMMLALPGSAYLYQGEELGLPEVTDLPPHVLTDPIVTATGDPQRGRDGCRVPLPWSGTQAPFGFSGAAGADTWLPQPDWFAAYSVESRRRDGSSSWHLYREALQLRRSLAPLRDPELRWLAGPPESIVFARGDGFLCAVNFSDSPVAAPVPGQPVLSSTPCDAGKLAANSAAWWLLDRHPHLPGSSTAPGTVRE